MAWPSKRELLGERGRIPAEGRVNYCGGCGNLLRPRSERKQVTVLFTDVCGFTAMSERLDPEDVRAIMDRAFDVILDAVHRHEGTPCATWWRRSRLT